MSEIIILEAIQAMMREAEDPTCRMCVIVDSHRDFRDRLWPYFGRHRYGRARPSTTNRRVPRARLREVRLLRLPWRRPYVASN